MNALLKENTTKALKQLYGVAIDQVEFQATRKDFEGDITIVTFPFTKYIKKNPAEIAEKLGDYLKKNLEEVENFNVVKGFLNLVISGEFYTKSFYKMLCQKDYGFQKENSVGKTMMVEYCSPNTNKPIHLGHLRNILLGYSLAEISKAAGKKVYKTQIINDRGIHICKSMLAWQKFGDGETPASSGMKGDKLVGKYYVLFDKVYKQEVALLIAEGKSNEAAKKEAPILLETQEMLRKWEASDEEVLLLWKKMNQWVYDGFEETFKKIGIDFDKIYYESETYLLGKEMILKGIDSQVFYKKEDGSVWIDLTDKGLDEKLVLRSDGTSVYITQDIATAIERFKDYALDELIYTVGNEQDYHFKVLFIILKKLGFGGALNLHHLSYAMVDLPSGKMKSREGTVVDADDLLEEMTETAKNISQELGKLDHYSEEKKTELYKTIGLGALKYFILKVDPKKRILFDPKESIDFNGNTGPFIQYTYARIQSILRKVDFEYHAEVSVDFEPKEKELIKVLESFPVAIQTAASQHSPAIIANYTYELVKLYNTFYQGMPILNCEQNDKKIFRVQLSKKVGETIKSAFALLGIEVPDSM
jgi:arginyl-tRNA synthetase